MKRGDFLKSILLLPVVGEVLMKPKVLTPKYLVGLYAQIPADKMLPYTQLTEDMVREVLGLPKVTTSIYTLDFSDPNAEPIHHPEYDKTYEGYFNNLNQ